MNPIQTKPLCASTSNLADMSTMVNPIALRGHSSKGKVTMGIIDKYGVRGDATLCIVIFLSPPNSVGGDIVMRPFVGGLVSEWVRACLSVSITLYLVDTIATTVFMPPA